MHSLIHICGAGDDAYINVITLIRAIAGSGRDYIIAGHSPCPFSLHAKPHSLDYWLRERFHTRRDIPLADRQVIRELVESGYFVPDNRLPCPDDGCLCRGLRLTAAALAVARRLSLPAVSALKPASE